MLKPVRPEAVLLNRALCLQTFSHFLIVNLSLSLSLSLSPSLSLVCDAMCSLCIIALTFTQHLSSGLSYSISHLPPPTQPDARGHSCITLRVYFFRTPE